MGEAHGCAAELRISRLGGVSPPWPRPYPRFGSAHMTICSGTQALAFVDLALGHAKSGPVEEALQAEIPGDDEVSYNGGTTTIDAGNQNETTNAPVNISANAVWALLLEVKM